MIQIEKGEGLGDVYDILLSTCMYTDSDTDLTIKALNDSELARFSPLWEVLVYYFCPNFSGGDYRGR